MINNIYMTDEVAKRIRDNKLEIDVTIESDELQQVHIQPWEPYSNYANSICNYGELKSQLDRLERKLDLLLVNRGV